MKMDLHLIHRNYFDPKIMERLRDEIIRQFDIENNPLEVHVSRYNPTGRNLFPDFIPDDIFQYLYGCFGWPDFFGATNSTVSIHKKPPIRENIGAMSVWHTDQESFKWSPAVDTYSVWCPLTDVGKEKSPGLKFKMGNEVIFPELSLGDCIVFSNKVRHGTAYTAEQTETRYSIDFRLISCKGSPPVNGDERVFMYPFEKSQRFAEIAGDVTVYHEHDAMDAAQ